MSQFSTEIRRSPEWWSQFKDETFRNKWIEIGLNREWVIQTPSQSKGVRLSRRQVSQSVDSRMEWRGESDPGPLCLG